MGFHLSVATGAGFIALVAGRMAGLAMVMLPYLRHAIEVSPVAGKSADLQRRKARRGRRCIRGRCCACSTEAMTVVAVIIAGLLPILWGGNRRRIGEVMKSHRRARCRSAG